MDAHEYITGRCTAAVAEEAEWDYWRPEALKFDPQLPLAECRDVPGQAT